MKRILLLISAVSLVLALPPGASARVVELGAENPPATASCPTDPCEVLARVTGYPGRAGSVKNPYLIRRDGYLVAFTVALGKPTPEQAAYFTDDPAGPQFGEPEVQLSVLRKGTKRKTRLDHRLISQSPVFDVTHNLGSSPDLRPARPNPRQEGQHRRPHVGHLAAGVREQPRQRQLVAFVARAQGAARRRRASTSTP